MVRLKHKRYLLKIAASSLILAATLGITACKQKTPPQMPAMPVSVIEIQSKDVPSTLEIAGQTAGSREVEVRARVGGILLARKYIEGSFVKQGDVLFQLDPATFKASLDQAKANLDVQLANSNSATKNFKRLQPLLKEKAISQLEYDNSLASYTGAQAAVAAAKAAVKQAQLNLDYATVRAPISGYTSSETMSIGSLINTSGLMTKISQTDPIYANFSYSDNERLKMRKAIESGQLRVPSSNKMDVYLKLSDDSMYPYVGRLTFSDSLIDSATSTINSRAEFPNPNKQLLPGQFVRVILKGSTRVNAIEVPQIAVITTQQGKAVWVVTKEGKVAQRFIETTAEDGGSFIVDKGLANGDKVVVDNIQKLRPGASVQARLIDYSQVGVVATPAGAATDKSKTSTVTPPSDAKKAE